MRRAIWIAAFFIAHAVFAQQTLTSVLRQHAKPWKIDALDGELERAQFFLIGEEHGAAEMGKLASALLPRAWKRGYRHYAIEVSPVMVERFAAARDPLAAIVQFNHKYPSSLPFLTWREEAEAFAVAMQLGGGRRDAVWGLDQEFYFSAKADLDRLAALAKSDRAQRAVAELQGHDLTSAAIATLREPFTSESNEARRLIAELAESWRIYDLYFAHKPYENNLERSKLLRRNFRDHVRSARGKVLVKFGSTHLIRGRSFTNVFDLGTMIPELGPTFQLFVLPKRGHVNEGGKSVEYHADAAFAPFLDAALDNEPTLIDLRAARPHLGDISKFDAPLVQVLYGYDAVLVLPNVTPATNIE